VDHETVLYGADVSLYPADYAATEEMRSQHTSNRINAKAEISFSCRRISTPIDYAAGHKYKIEHTVNFMDLARAARSLPETTTSQPLAPLSMMNRRTP
jgi:hypothetical protein